jgi:polysaccharide biosynthesis protein PslH
MKIFVLLSRVPYPIEKGDKLRAFHQIRCLAHNNEIILCALSDSTVHPDAKKILGGFCSEVHIIPIGFTGMIWNILKAFFNGKPMQAGYFYRSGVKHKIDLLIKKTKPDHIYCQLIRVSEYVKESPIPKTLDYQDIFSTGALRQAETAPFWKRPFLQSEYCRLVKYEHDVFDYFNHKTIISLPDRNLLQHPLRDEVIIVPNGVDQEYFKPVSEEKTYDIVFTGNMGYPPNIDAARFIVKEIFPLVLEQIPAATLLLAGANPHPKVLALQASNILVTGWLSDIRESYSASHVFIAPMRIGTGLQNKLLEAMSMQLPCITSELANQALGAKQNIEILVGSTPEVYANHIIHLLKDDSFAKKLAESGNAFIRNTFSWENTAKQLESLFNTH